ncbi:MAG: hypothetical protein WD873_00185 [Candidatus Hydrogenedentales bacterium]
MIAVAALLLLLTPFVLAAGFQQTEMDGSDSAQLFVAPLDDQGNRAIFLADSAQLLIFMPPDYDAPMRYALPAETAYLDVADVDGDGQTEVIIVAGQDVYTAAPAAQLPLQRLAQLPAAAPSPTRGPIPTYIAHRANGGVVLRVPARDGYQELPLLPDAATPALQDSEVQAAGQPTTETTAPSAADPGAVDHAFSPAAAVELFAVTPPQTAPPDGVEYVMHPYGGLAAAPLADAPQYQRSGTVAQARDAADLPPEDWPWFYLQSSTGAARALYALDPPDFDRTLLRIAARDAKRPLGPARMYPGAIVPPRDHPPDFNGDGWADLLLWRAPAPTFSLSSLTRWAQSGRWSLDLMVHLFDPSSMRYQARPAALLRTRVPLAGFLEPEAGLPVSLWVLNDFDGDGQDDLLLKTEPRRLDLWLFRGQFADEPDAALELAEPVTQIEFSGPLQPNGPAILIVRTQTKRHLIRFKDEM